MLIIFVVVLTLWSLAIWLTIFCVCFLVVMLAFWSSSLSTAHFAFCFLSVCIALVFGAA